MKKFSVLVGLVILSLTNIYAQKKVLDKVVAVVGDNIILKSELDQQYAQYLVQGNKPDETTLCFFYRIC